MLSDADLNDLVLMLQTHSPLVRLNHSEAVAVLELMQQRGWTINKPMPAVEAGRAS
ncbi:hypothetical protein H8A95_05150 [Bradyrhizobium sp. Pear76]|uniref:hypothetical protein n=1 Tax=Bradyrhizobium oropedii TaxID=1571201 RepID=UPI001E608EB8|nr:hypothetical protein [Bradyrhizobium oropedii]MCC8961722.1 hypothetical protein [Bradyrhizobium oropedii]